MENILSNTPKQLLTFCETCYYFLTFFVDIQSTINLYARMKDRGKIIRFWWSHQEICKN